MSLKMFMSLVGAVLVINGCSGGQNTENTGGQQHVLAVSINRPTSMNYFSSTVNVLGDCSEAGRDVVLSGTGGVSATVSCSTSNDYATVLDFTAVDDGNVTITANHSDASGNAATPVSVTVRKDSVPASVSILTPIANSRINLENQTNLSLNGTCSEDGQDVLLAATGGVSSTVLCASGAWSATLDLTRAADGNVGITADHSDLAGNAAVQASVVLLKDTTAPESIVITAPVAGAYINHSNYTAFRISGNCPENGTSNVIIFIGSNPIGSPLNCSNGNFSGVFDFSSQSDGAISLAAKYVDDFGNSRTSAPVVIAKDVAVPAAVAIVTPLDGAYINQANQTTFEVSGICSENGSANVLIQIDGVTKGSPLNCDNGVFSRSMDLSGLGEGSLTMAVILSDLAGNSSTSTTVHLTKDTEAPTSVSVIVPIAGAFINFQNQYSYFVSGSCSESGNNNLRVYGNSTLAGTLSCSDGEFRGLVDFSSLDNGSVNVSTVLFDEAGNSIISNAVPTVKDAIPPQVRILEPLAGAYLNENAIRQIEISGTCSEQSANVVIQAQGDNLGDALNCQEGHFSGFFDLTSQSDGSITLTAKQIDLAGNEGTSQPVIIIKDTQVPVVSITTPLNGGYINFEDQAKFTIGGSCSEDGSKNIVVKADAEVIGESLDCVSGQFSGKFDFSSKDEVSVTLTVILTDLAKNAGISDAIQVTKDTVPPTFAAIGHLADPRFINNEKNRAFAISGTCAEDGVSNVVIRVGSVDAGSAVDCVAGEFSGSFDFANIPEGVVAVKAYNFDRAGNSVASESAELTKDTVLPVVSIGNSVAGSYINVSNQAQFVVTGQCSENGTANVSIKSQGALLVDPVDCNQHEFTATYDFSSYADGSIPVTVSQTDKASNSFTSEPVMLVKDTVGPELVLIQGPLADSYINESNQSALIVFGLCSDNGIKNVGLKVGDKLVGERISCESGEFSGQFDLSLENTGLLSLSVVHWDAAGNDLTSNPVVVIKDIDPPSLAKINTPVSGSYISGSNYSSLHVSGECSEDGTDNVLLYNDDQYLKTFNCQSGAFGDDVDFTEIADGNIDLRIHHLDVAGNVKISNSVSVIKDTVLPEWITISNSGRDLYISSLNQNMFSIYGVCSDDGIGNVVIKKDSVQIGQPLNCADNQFRNVFDFSLEAEGSYVFTVEHLDAAGNKRESGQVTIVKDVTPPTFVTIVEPAAGAYVNNGNQTEFVVSGTCSENGVEAIITKIGDIEVGDPIACEGGSYHGKFNLSAKLDGLLALTVVHTDTAGNPLNSDPVEINKDTEAPRIVTIAEPLDGTYLSQSASSSVRISGDCSTEVPTSSVVIKIGSGVLGNSLVCNNGKFGDLFDFSVFDDGPITLTAVYSDLAGNFIESTPVTVTKDSVPPAFVVITRPLTGSYINLNNQSSLIISGTCSDDGTKNLIVKAGSKVLGESLDCIAGEFSGSFDLTQEEGEVILSAVLTDIAGNDLTSEPVLLIKDIEPPTIVKVDVPLPGVYINFKYQNTFVVSGECSEDGFENIIIKAGSTIVGHPVNCDGGRFTGEFDFSSQSEGPVHIIAALSDVAGNQVNSEPVIVIKDTVAPESVAIDISLENTYINNDDQASVTISGSCSESTPNNTVVIQTGEMALGPSVACEDGRYTALIDMSSQLEGSINLTALHSDAAGNSVSSMQVAIIKDTIAPGSVVITAPATGDYIHLTNQSAFEISGSCSEAGTENVIIKIGSVAIGNSLDCQDGRFSGVFDVKSLDEGAININANLTDLAGNVLTSELVAILKDTVPPASVGLSTPVQDEYINSEKQAQFSVAGECSENGIGNVAIESENKVIGDRFSCENGQFQGALDLSLENEGILYFTAVVYDLAGNRTTSNLVRVIKDTVAPAEIAIMTPTPASRINQSIQKDVTISGSCSEDGTNNVTIQTGITPIEQRLSCADGSFTGSFDLSTYPEGSIVLTAIILDLAGNARTSNPVEIIKDTQSPTSIAISTPIAGAYINSFNQAEFLVSGECSETELGNSVVIKANSNAVGNLISCKTGHFETILDFSSFEDGLVNLTAEHFDAAGNATISNAVAISKDTEAPEFVLMTSPTENFYINNINQKSISVSGFCSTTESGNQVVIQARSNVLGNPLICSGGEFKGEFDMTLLPDGPMDIVAQHFDAAGNLLESIPVHVLKDVQPPTLIAISLPAVGDYINQNDQSNFTVSGTCSETELNNSVLIEAAGNILGSPLICSDGKFSGAFDFSFLMDGPISLTAVHADAAGNSLSSDVVLIKKDTVAPAMVSIAVPVANAYINNINVNAFTISGICSEIEFNNQVIIYIDGNPIGSPLVCEDGEFSGNFDLGSLDDGSVALTATYLDAAKNSVISDSITVSKDTQSPQFVWITTPDQDSSVNYSNQTQFVVSGTCSDVVLGNKVVIKAGDSVVGQQLICENQMFSGIFDFSMFPDGLISLAAEHFDQAGNIVVSIPVVVNKDTHLPGSIVITSPVAGTYINNAHQLAFTVSGTCVDVGPNNTVVIKAGSLVLGDPLVCTDSQFSGYFNFIAIEEGTVSLTAEIIDSSGNSLVSAPVIVTKDTLAPDFVIITSPLNNNYIALSNQKNVQISGNCSENGVNNKVVIVADSGELAESLICTDGQFSGEFDLSKLADGEINLIAIHSDAAGNSQSSSPVVVIKDTNPPTSVAITEPKVGGYINLSSQSYFQVTGTCSELMTGSTVVVKNGANSLGIPLECIGGTFSGQYDLSFIEDGEVVLSAEHADAAGNVTISGSVTLAKDTVAPVSVAITTPVAGIYINQSQQTVITISGTCSEIEPKNSVVIKSDTSPVGDPLVCESGAFVGSFNLSAQNEGNLSLTAVHYDAAGNATNSEPVVVVKDTLAPDFIIVSSPSEGSYIGSSNLEHVVISGVCADVSPANKVVIKANGITVEESLFCVGGEFSSDVNFSTFEDGTISIIAEHIDPAGNLVSSNTVSLIKDTQAPEFVAISSPVSNSYINFVGQSSILVSGTCANVGSNNTVIIKANSLVIGDSMTCVSGEFSGYFNFSTLSDGLITLTADYSDAAGNVVSSVGINVTKDTAPPSSVVIASPIADAYINSFNQESFTVSGTCSEKGTANVVLIVGEYVVGSPVDCTETGFTGEFNLTSQLDGVLGLRVVLTDVAGNSLTSSSIIVNKDLQPPTFVTITSPSASAYINYAGQAAVSISGICSDSEPNNTVVIKAGETPLGFALSCIGGEFSGVFDLSAEIDGSVLLSAVHKDAAGNSLTSDTVIVTKDTQAPSSVVLNPLLANEVISSKNLNLFEITGSCSETTPDNIVVVKAGLTTLGIPLTCSGGLFSGTFMMSDLSDGAIVLTAEHVDAAGNTLVSSPVTVKKDTQAPVAVSISNPISGEFINADHQNAVMVEGTCSENELNNKIIIKANGTTLGNSYTCQNNVFSGSIDLSGISDGMINLTVEHLDAAENSLISQSVVVNKDTEAPSVVTITVPTTGFYINNNGQVMVTITGVCSENSSGNSIVIKVGTTQLGNSLVCDQGAFTGNFDFTAVADGNITLRALHSDAAGNVLTSNSVELIKDTESPASVAIAVSVTDSYINILNQENFTVSGTCTENEPNNTVIIKAGGTTLGTSLTCVSGAFTGTFDFSGFVDGPVSLIAEHSDAAGNVVESTAINVEKDTQSPTLVVINSPLNLSYINQMTQSAVMVSGICSESGQKNVIIRVGSSIVGDPLDCIHGEFTGDFDFTFYLDGNLTLTAELSDQAGNLLLSTPISVIKDIELPTIVLRVDHSYVNVMNQSAFAFSGSCSDSGIDNVVIMKSDETILSILNCGIDHQFSGNINLSDPSVIAEGATLGLMAKNTDAAENSKISDIVPVIKDTVLPTVALEPETTYVNSLNQDVFPIAGSCSDEGTDNVKIYNSTNQLFGSFNCGSNHRFSGTVNLTVLADDIPDTLIAEHTEVSGNNKDSAPVPIIKDTVLPTVALQTKDNSVNSLNQAEFTVFGTCSDSGLSNIKIYNLGSDLLGATDCGSDHQFTLNLDLTAMPENSTYRLTARHADAAGNLRDSSQKSITKDTIPPIVTLETVSPYVNSINAQEFSFSGDCSDVGTNNVNIIRKPNFILNTVSCQSDGRFTAVINLSDNEVMPESAVFEFVAQHLDAAGNSNLSDPLSITKDTELPTISFSAESPYVISTNVTSFSLTGNCSAPGLDNVRIRNEENNIILGIFSCNSDQSFGGDLDLTSMPGGATYSLVAEHLDPAGNKQLSAPVSVIKDTIAPMLTLSLAGPYVNIQNQSAFSFSGDCSEPNRSVKIVNLANVTLKEVNCDSSQRYSGELDLTGMSEGAKDTLSAVMTDIAGNQATASSPEIEKDTVSPTVTLVAESLYVNIANADTFTLSGTCSESGDNNVKIYNDANDLLATFSCSNDNTFGGDINLSSADVMLENSIFNLRAEHTDFALNKGISPIPVSITKDTLAPTVTLRTDGSYVNRINITAFTFSGDCSDAGNDNVNIYTTDNKLLGTQSCGVDGHFSFDIDLSSESVMPEAATYSVIARHIDAAQNVINSDPVMIIKDTVAPIVTLVAESPYVNSFNEGSFTISGVCSDPGLNNVKIYTSENSLLSELNCKEDGTFTTNLVLAAMFENSTYVLTAEHTDLAANKTISTEITITKDTIAPTAPANVNDGIQGMKLNPPLITWDATQDNGGGSGIDKYEISLASTLVSYADVLGWQNLGASATSGALTGLTPETALTVGNTYYTSVRVTDRAGNTVTAQGDGWVLVLCPVNYLEVPGLSGYTSNSFCVAKYEAKYNSLENPTVALSVASGTPWVAVSQVSAISYCQANGTGYDLINNAEWQTIARNIESTSSNWSTLDGTTVGVVGTGLINHGHSDSSPGNFLEADANDANACSGTEQTCSDITWDSQRRTHVLSNGKVIWDLAGNVAEWVNDTNATDYFGDTSVIALIQAASTNLGTVGGITGNAKLLFGPAGDYSNADYDNDFGGLGLASFASSESNFGGIIRGYDYQNPFYAGLFAVEIGRDVGSISIDLEVGFRCVYHPQ